MRGSVLRLFMKQPCLWRRPVYLMSSSGLEEVRHCLSLVQGQDGRSLMDQQVIVDMSVQEGKVQVELKLEQDFMKVKSLIQKQVRTLGWVTQVEVKLARREKEVEQRLNHKGGLSRVKKIIGVSSCKGGVGKSTVALNLAATLHKMGMQVGIFDADIYGPSLPTLVDKEKHTLETYPDSPKDILPVEYNGIKTMSFGYAHKTALMRGPMVSQVVLQLLFNTQWGELDYLVMDMPPGTGDVQITLGQEVRMDGAVIVTTPQKLAFVDVIKGIEMFDQLNVKVLSVVNNMAYFLCGQCDTQHRIFGPGYLSLLHKQLGMEESIELPLLPDISKYSDQGSPIVYIYDDIHPLNQAYRSLAHAIRHDSPHDNPMVRYETGSQKVVLHGADGQVIKKVESRMLRYLCGCASCVDEFTDQRQTKYHDIREDVFPAKIQKKGNYAVAIVWSDGHSSSIYPYKVLLSEQVPNAG